MGNSYEPNKFQYKFTFFSVLIIIEVTDFSILFSILSNTIVTTLPTFCNTRKLDLAI